MKSFAVAAGLLSAVLSTSALAVECPTPTGIPHLDHVFVIMMENHGYGQIIGNPNAPFINQYAQSANLATNYFAVAHPSLTNYLEVVGGSNFGVHTDNYPNWHNTTCLTNLSTGTVATDNPPSGLICPISGTGTDAETPAVDTTNETQGAPGDNNIDGTRSIPAATNISGKTIADQLVAHGYSWKSYQENIGPQGPDGVNVSDGVYTNLTDFSKITATDPAITSGGIVYQYAVKHNPFAYFQNIQSGTNPKLSYAQIADFEGPGGLFSDLAGGLFAAFAGGHDATPTYSFIAPNQCNDQHGRGNAGPFCNYDPSDDGQQAGLNPALIARGDVEVQKLVSAIHASPVWKFGHTAIITVWDENDYSTAPNTNQVVAIIDTNYGSHGKTSNTYYNHFSLLKSIEAGLKLPCLNHACDTNVAVMSDLFN